MQARYLKKGLLTAVQQGVVEDEKFFIEHLDRSYRIREPITTVTEGQQTEFEQEFLSLGSHDASRRRVIVKRMGRAKATMFGLRFMPIPFLLFADESIQDDDATLEPIFNGIMKNAAVEYGVKT